MSELCNRVLAADKQIRSALFVNEEGEILCEQTRLDNEYAMPKEMVWRFAGVWASVIGGIFQQVAQFNGPFEYCIVKHEKTTTVGLAVEKGYLIFTTREEDSVQQLIKKTRDTLTLKAKV